MDLTQPNPTPDSHHQYEIGSLPARTIAFDQIVSVNIFWSDVYQNAPDKALLYSQHAVDRGERYGFFPLPYTLSSGGAYGAFGPVAVFNSSLSLIHQCIITNYINNIGHAVYISTNDRDRNGPSSKFLSTELKYWKYAYPMASGIAVDGDQFSLASEKKSKFYYPVNQEIDAKQWRHFLSQEIGSAADGSIYPSQERYIISRFTPFLRIHLVSGEVVEGIMGRFNEWQDHGERFIVLETPQYRKTVDGVSSAVFLPSLGAATAHAKKFFSKAKAAHNKDLGIDPTTYVFHSKDVVRVWSEIPAYKRTRQIHSALLNQLGPRDSVHEYAQTLFEGHAAEKANDPYWDFRTDTQTYDELIRVWMTQGKSND